MSNPGRKAHFSEEIFLYLLLLEMYLLVGQMVTLRHFDRSTDINTVGKKVNKNFLVSS
jgi:hypothetical protein